MKKAISLLCILALCLTLLVGTMPTAVVSAETSGDFEYTILADGIASINDYTGSATELTIPSTLDGYTVTSIGMNAFSGCHSLVSITIPDGVTGIGEHAFADCTSLVSITLPGSVARIEPGAFSFCSNLANIAVDDTNTAFMTLDGVLFSKDQTRLILYPAGNDNTAYTIPNSVTYIYDYAFHDCSSLVSITIPDSVRRIGPYAFNGCSSLVSITIPDGVTGIWDFEFSGCHSLVNITIPDSVTYIGMGAFTGCSSLVSITIPDGVTYIGTAFSYIGTAFSGCDNLTLSVYADSYALQYAVDNSIPYSIVKDAVDEATGVTMEGIPEDVTLEVNLVSQSEDSTTYNITLTKDGEEVQPLGAVKVKIPVPAGMDAETCKVYRMEEGGTKTDMNAKVVDGYMVFTTTHFSLYTVERKTITAGDLNNDSSIDLDDATRLFYHVNGLLILEAAVFTAADLNDDGMVDLTDATKLFYIVNGLA